MTDTPLVAVLDELTWRGSVEQSTDESALRAALAEGPITVYCGFDPTAPSLHFGNLVQLVVLRRFQRAGHRVICLVGGSTGLIGDPRTTSERVLRTKEHTAANVARLKELVRPFLDFDGDNAALLVDNLDWTAPMSAIDFLRDVGKHFRVNQMIRKEAIAQRLASQEGISFTEFSYQLLQALDYLRALPRPRVHAADRRVGPVGEHHRRRRPGAPGRRRDGARVDDPADHRRVRGEVREVRGQRDLDVAPT